MKTYRFKQGAGKHRMRVGGKLQLVKPDEVVELTDEQFQACKDKFVAADAGDDGPSSEELFRMAEAKEKREKAAEQANAKAAALAKAKAEERAADAAKAEADKAKAGTGNKG